MVKKQSVFLILILCFFSLFSMGFASWHINVELTDQYASGVISVDDVIRFDDYVSFEDITILKYTNNGFEEDGNTLVINAKINLQKCRANLGSDTTIQLKFQLTYFNNNVNNDYDILSCITKTTAIANLDNVKKGTTNNSEVIVELPLTKFNQNEISVTITYLFEANDLKYFNNENSPLIKDRQNLFKIKTMLSAEKDN